MSRDFYAITQQIFFFAAGYILKGIADNFSELIFLPAPMIIYTNSQKCDYTFVN
jgi:hypothetical protein